MRPNGQDPHRTLGVPQGAGEAEIRRAYRALAKRHHPDARDGSAARFIEIQAAYEALLGAAPPGVPPGRKGRRPAQQGTASGASRGGAAGEAGPPGAGSGARRGPPPGSSWARRPHNGAGAAPEAGAGGPPGRGGAGTPGPPPGPGSGASARRAGADDTRRRTGRRRATLGSTSYDEAEGTFEPDWGGASWYGTSSGTFWTINPKEYADPRKHGPEYQARARRASAEAGTTEAAAGRSTPGDLPPAWRARAWTAAGEPRAARPVFEHEPDPATAAPGEADEATRQGPSAPGDPPPGAPGDPPPAARIGAAAAPPAGAGSTAAPGNAVRTALALGGWLAPGLALASLAGLPGGILATIPLQAAGVALLALQPRLAWAALGGGVALVFAAIPIVALVAALGGLFVPGGPAPGAAVGLAVLAWAAGVLAVGSGRVAPYPWDPAARPAPR